MSETEKMLQAWLVVTMALESESHLTRQVVLMRTGGRSLAACRLALISAGYRGVTKERIRQIEAKVKRQIEAFLLRPDTNTTEGIQC